MTLSWPFSTLANTVPSIFTEEGFARHGGLASYEPVFKDIFRRAADYVDRILKGDKPADLPVQQPAKFQLVINLKTANALHLAVPDKLLATADEAIESASPCLAKEKMRYWTTRARHSASQAVHSFVLHAPVRFLCLGDFLAIRKCAAIRLANRIVPQRR